MFNAYMTDTVTLIEKSGDSTWGEQTETETVVKARIDYKNRLVRDFAGEQVISSAMVTIKNRTLSPSARVKIDGVEHPILSFSKVRAFKSNPFLEVHLG